MSDVDPKRSPSGRLPHPQGSSPPRPPIGVMKRLLLLLSLLLPLLLPLLLCSAALTCHTLGGVMRCEESAWQMQQPSMSTASQQQRPFDTAQPTWQQQQQQAQIMQQQAQQQQQQQAPVRILQQPFSPQLWAQQLPLSQQQIMQQQQTQQQQRAAAPVAPPSCEQLFATGTSADLSSYLTCPTPTDTGFATSDASPASSSGPKDPHAAMAWAAARGWAMKLVSPPASADAAIQELNDPLDILAALQSDVNVHPARAEPLPTPLMLEVDVQDEPADATSFHVNYVEGLNEYAASFSADQIFDAEHSEFEAAGSGWSEQQDNAQHKHAYLSEVQNE